MPKTVQTTPSDQSRYDAKIKKLRDARKNLPPQYYDSTVDHDLTISSDTEDALILLPSESKRKAVDYMKAFSDSSKTTTDDFNELLAEFIDKQIEVSAAVKQDLSQVTGKFQDFRSSVLQSGDADEEIKSGLTAPLQAMVKSLGRLGRKETREQFHDTFNIAAKTLVKPDGDKLKRELRSWVRVFVSYP